MAVEWLNDDLTLKPGFEQYLPAEVRDYAKDAKDLPSLLKRGLDTQRDLHSRIKIPDTPEGKREVLAKHFKDVLDADAAAAKKAQDESAAKAKSEQEAAVEAANKAQMEKAQAAAKALLGGADGKAYDSNLELARRAVRGEHCPLWIKEGIAKLVGTEVGKLTDDQIKAAIHSDPAVAQTLLTIGNLTRDGRTEHGDGHNSGVPDKTPMQPKCPELYKNRPDTDPEKQWFIRRGYSYQSGEWEGRPPQ